MGGGGGEEGGEGGEGGRREVVGPFALAKALAALLRERVGALVHPVPAVCSDVTEAHVDALASQARQGALVLVHQRAVAARCPRSGGGADRELRVGQDEHRRPCAVREHLVRPRERVVDGRELACVVGALGGFLLLNVGLTRTRAPTATPEDDRGEKA